MHINAAFDRPAAVLPADHTWVPSPLPGVERVMLDRIGGEVARATSLVRYAPNSRFDAHTHGGGEEFFVLAGTFCDEHGAYPAGTYARNPIGTRHTPFTDTGCLLFVKLWQFAADDDAHFATDTGRAPWQTDDGGATTLTLHTHPRETVRLLRLGPGVAVPVPAVGGGAEVLVLDGAVGDGARRLDRLGWCRLPAGTGATLTAAAEGATLYLKTGHLRGPIAGPAT